nr:hypothetical protein 2 [Dehalococcoidia bacterium]
MDRSDKVFMTFMLVLLSTAAIYFADQFLFQSKEQTAALQSLHQEAQNIHQELQELNDKVKAIENDLPKE